MKPVGHTTGYRDTEAIDSIVRLPRTLALLQKEQISEYKETFSLFDKDGNGTISLSELREVMHALGEQRTDEDLQYTIKELDTDGDGLINFDEFLVMMAREPEGSDVNAELKRAFDVFDKDGDGKITVGELKKIVKDLGMKLTDEELQQMIQEADSDRDGHVNYEEFVTMMGSH